FIKRHVGLRDDVLVFFPSGKIEAVRFVDDFAPLQLFVELFDLVARDDFAGFEFAVTSIDDLHVVDDAAALNLAVGRFDEAVIIDARETAQGADETDVRTFGGFNRADAAVVRRVHVADFEPRALPREAARPKCREAALVRDFAERVGLVHELAKLDRKSTRLNSSHRTISYAVFCLKKKKKNTHLPSSYRSLR